MPPEQPSFRENSNPTPPEERNTLPYRLTIENKSDVLWACAEGVQSLETTLAMARDILAACVEHKVSKVLIDVRSLKGKLGTLDSYDIVHRYIPKMNEPEVITECAVVDLKEHEETYKFFEDVAVNQGFKVRIFPETGPALQWLKNQTGGT